ncbi:unnamed protein product, partial [Amoebophrya sp. A120]|eukprot:GSA120T00016318001.1
MVRKIMLRKRGGRESGTRRSSRTRWRTRYTNKWASFPHDKRCSWSAFVALSFLLVLFLQAGNVYFKCSCPFLLLFPSAFRVSTSRQRPRRGRPGLATTPAARSHLS